MPFRHKAYRVLQVEDNADNAKLTEMLLAKEPEFAFEVHSVSTLEEAMQALTERQFDVVLLDVGLPDAAGLEGFAKIHEAHPDMPVVLLTGRNHSGMVDQALKSGAQDYLQKGRVPTFGELLSRSLYYAIERNRTASGMLRILGGRRALDEYLPTVSVERLDRFQEAVTHLVQTIDDATTTKDS